MFDAPRDKTSKPDQPGDTTNFLAGMSKMMNDTEANSIIRSYGKIAGRTSSSVLPDFEIDESPVPANNIVPLGGPSYLNPPQMVPDQSNPMWPAAREHLHGII